MMRPTTPRHERDFQYHFSNVMEQIKVAYLHQMPEKSRDDVETIMKAMMIVEADAEVALKKCRVAGAMKVMDIILVAFAYCSQALREHGKNRKEIAWTYLIDATYYSGVALHSRAVEIAWPDIELATRLEAVAAPKRMGGTAKNAGWKKVEDEAVRLVKILGEQGQRWSTERKMADSIRSDLVPFALGEVPELSQKRYVQTISGRLKLRSTEIGIYLTKRKNLS